MAVEKWRHYHPMLTEHVRGAWAGPKTERNGPKVWALSGTPEHRQFCRSRSAHMLTPTCSLWRIYWLAKTTIKQPSRIPSFINISSNSLACRTPPSLSMIRPHFPLGTLRFVASSVLLDFIAVLLHFRINASLHNAFHNGIRIRSSAAMWPYSERAVSLRLALWT